MQSPNSMKLSMLSINVSASRCPLNLTYAMVWTTKGIDSLNPTTMDATTTFYKFLALYISLYSPDWYCAFHLSSKHNRKKRSLFHELFLTLLTHQHHFVEFDLTMAKTALQIFQVKTCLLGVTYNVNVSHSISLILNTVVSHAVSSMFFSPLGQLLKILSKQISLIHMYTYFW